MAQRQALIIEANGERFRFYYDPEHPEVLHIALRHSTTPEDAIRTFLEGETESWDKPHMRFETVTETHGIYWTRHPHDQSVIIVSCFRRGDENGQIE